MDVQQPATPRPSVPAPNATHPQVHDFLQKFLMSQDCYKTSEEASRLARKAYCDGWGLYSHAESYFTDNLGSDGILIYKAVQESKYAEVRDWSSATLNHIKPDIKYRGPLSGLSFTSLALAFSCLPLSLGLASSSVPPEKKETSPSVSARALFPSSSYIGSSRELSSSNLTSQTSSRTEEKCRNTQRYGSWSGLRRRHDHRHSTETSKFTNADS